MAPPLPAASQPSKTHTDRAAALGGGADDAVEFAEPLVAFVLVAGLGNLLVERESEEAAGTGGPGAGRCGGLRPWVGQSCGCRSRALKRVRTLSATARLRARGSLASITCQGAPGRWVARRMVSERRARRS